MLDQGLSSIYLSTAFIFLAGFFYLIIILVKNFISTKNLMHALGFGYGSFSIPDSAEHAVRCFYSRQVVHEGPSIGHFILCVGMLRGSASFFVVRERFFDKVFKFVGVNSELQTGFHWFDRRYYIVSETNERKKFW